MPMVVIKEGVKESSLKRSRQHDLPTPESPMRRSLICGLTRISGQMSAFDDRDRALSSSRYIPESHNSVMRP